MSPHRLPALLVVSLSTAACSGKIAQVLDSEPEAGVEAASCTSGGGTCVESVSQCALARGQSAKTMSCAGTRVCCFLPTKPCDNRMFDCCEGPVPVAAYPRCTGAAEEKETAECLPGQTKANVGQCGKGPGAGTAPPDTSDCSLQAPCGTSFARDVLPLLVASCGSATCHGTPNGVKPQLDSQDPSTTWRNLIAQKPITGRPYVAKCNPDPAASSILCNLAKSGSSCGISMPLTAPGSLEGSWLDKALQSWLTCGAPYN
jgi:hypothetical protein